MSLENCSQDLNLVKQKQIRDLYDSAIGSLNGKLSEKKLPIIQGQYVKNMNLGCLDGGTQFLRWKRHFQRGLLLNEKSKWLQWLMEIEKKMSQRFFQVLEKVELGMQSNWVLMTLSCEWANLEVLCVILEKVHVELASIS